MKREHPVVGSDGLSMAAQLHQNAGTLVLQIECGRREADGAIQALDRILHAARSRQGLGVPAQNLRVVRPQVDGAREALGRLGGAAASTWR